MIEKESTKFKGTSRKVLSLLIALTIILSCLLVSTPAVNAASNLALGKAVYASSTENATYPASNVTDGNTGTRWSSAFADTQWIYIDLGSLQSVSGVVLNWEASYAKQFQIQTSTDNVSWTTVYSNYSGTGGVNTINFTPVNARYVKMYALQRATTYGYSLWEFEVYGSGSSTIGVLDYLKSISGSKTVIGIHNREPNSSPALQTDKAYSITGNYPGLWSGDFLFSSDDVNNRWTMINECKNQWDKGSIVQIMMHVVPPTQSEPGNWDGGVVSKLTDAQWTSLVTDGSSLNTVWKARLDNYAQYLQYLKDNNVTVLFRPFHEMNQGVFWWAGRSGSTGTAALYRLTHDYLVNTKGLTNLIWVWDMQDLDLNWSGYNPGSNYWDIFALDVYNGDGYTTAKYNTALSVAGGKPIAVGECQVLPTSSQLAAQPKWVFCMSWAELTFQYNTNAQIQNLYWADNVIVRNELPNFKVNGSATPTPTPPAATVTPTPTPTPTTTPAPTTTPVPGQPDLVVTDITWSPANYAAGNPVTFSAIIKNQGTGSKNAGTITGASFFVDGTQVSWSDNNTSSLAPGASVTVTANGGPSGAAWTATSGNHTVMAWVDDVNRIAESNESNNQFSKTLAPGPTSTPTPTPNATATPTPTPTPTPLPSNLAQGKSITCNNYTQTYVAANANDGNTATYWEGAANSYPNTLTVDLGSSQSVSKVTLKLNPNASWGARTQTLSVQGSNDNSTYTNLVNSVAYTFDPVTGNTVTINFTGTSQRYIRLNFTANTGATGAQVAEFEVYR